MEAIEEYEDLMYLAGRRCPRRRRGRLDPMTEYDDEEFVNRFRLKKEAATYIVDTVGDAIQPTQIRNGMNLSAEQKVLVTLRFLATGNYQRVDGDLMGISQSSVSRIVH